MPLKVETLTRQLEQAQQVRSEIEKQFDGAELKKQPKWRQANANVTNLEARLDKAQSRSGAPAGESEGSEEE